MKFRHACLKIKSLPTAKYFYIDLLGFEISHELVLEGEYIEKLLNKKGAIIKYVKLYAPKDDRTQPPTLEFHYWLSEINYFPERRNNSIESQHISITVENIDKLYKKMIDSGVEFLSKPLVAPDSGRKVCFCRDYEGNLIELVEENNENS